MKRPRRLNAAVVGAGLMGHWHARALVRAGGRVAAVVDTRPAAAARLARLYPGAVCFPNVHAMLSGCDIDAVHLCTPIETHHELGSRVLHAGRHLLVEKPVADTAAETEELLTIADAKGALLCPVHQFLFQPGFQRALDLIPAIGPLIAVDLVACSAGALAAPAAHADQVVIDILPHPLSLITRLLPLSAVTPDWTVHHPAPGELRASCRAGELSVGLLISMRGRPTCNTLRVTAARGTVHVDLFHGFCVVEAPDVSRGRKVVHPFTLSANTFAAASLNLARRALSREAAYPGLRELVGRFYGAVRGENAPPISDEETLTVATARDFLAREWLHREAPVGVSGYL